MRAFMRLFFTLVIPVTILIAVLLTLYFTVQYSFSQAMSLGVLYGLFSGVITTIILTIALLILRGGTVNIKSKFQKTEKENIDPIQTETPSVKNTSNNQNTTKNIQKSNKNIKNGIDQKLMLLMNKELTFEVILTTLKNQFSRSLTTQNIEKGYIDIKIQDESISIAVTPLTKNTSQVIINGTKHSKYVQNIILFLKEKEHSFLQY